MQLAKRTMGPVEVHLRRKRVARHRTARARRRRLAGTGRLRIPRCGPPMGNDRRQRGRRLASPVGRSRGVRQIDQLPEALRRKDVTADSSISPSLVVDGPPGAAENADRREPEYVVLVDSDQIRLEARLRYTVRGAKVFAVEIAMPDWQIDEVGPESVVAIDGVPTGASGRVSLPLATPTIGPFEVRVKAHRPLPRTRSHSPWRFPSRQASAGRGSGRGASGGQRRIVPDSQATTGLLRQQAAVPLELPPRQQEPLFYRSDAPQGRVRRGIAPPSPEDFRVGYQPRDPGTRRRPRRTEVRLRDRLRTDRLLPAGGPARIERQGPAGVELRRPGPGPVVLARGSGRWREAGADARGPAQGVHRALRDHGPLRAVVLGRRRATEHPRAAGHAAGRGICRQQRHASLRLRTSRSKSLRGVWTTVEGGLTQAASPRSRELAAAANGGNRGPPARRKLRRSGRGCRPGMDPDLRDQIARRGRQDRAVLQLTTRRHESRSRCRKGPCAIRPPCSCSESTRPAAIEPTADHRHAAHAGRANLIVPLSADVEPHALRAQPAISFCRAGAARACQSRGDEVRVPQPGRRHWIRRADWQLLLPPETHLISSPRDMTGEFVWGWNRFYFGREPVLGQADLEALGRSAHPASTPAPAGMNMLSFQFPGAARPV